MNPVLNRSRRDALLLGAGLVLSSAAAASRIAGDASPPAASAVLSSRQQPSPAQSDESASLRRGIVTAVDARGRRIRVHGAWLQLGADTKLVRNGRPATLDTLTVGEAIRFTIANGSTTAPALGLIYAP